MYYIRLMFGFLHARSSMSPHQRPNFNSDKRWLKSFNQTFIKKCVYTHLWPWPRTFFPKSLSICKTHSKQILHMLQSLSANHHPKYLNLQTFLVLFLFIVKIVLFALAYESCIFLFFLLFLFFWQVLVFSYFLELQHFMLYNSYLQYSYLPYLWYLF